MKHRIQKLLAQANLGSRRGAEELIIAGRVRVNGQVAELGAKADPDTDIITLDGERLNIKSVPRYIMYYKPVNVLSTTERQPGDDRPTVREMVPIEGHFFTIGRLDVESEGLVILTNDGDMANQLSHPRYEHTKTYKVTVYGEPEQRVLDTWERGIMLPEEETMTAPCSIRVQEQGGGQTTLRIVMTEGRNRQIRRVAAAMGHPVKRLMRTHIGKLGIGLLKKGEWVELTPDQLKELTTPHSELDYIDKLKKSNKAQNRRTDLMKYTTASTEQLDAARTNRQAPLLPRKPKKFVEREPMDGDEVARRRPEREGDERRPARRPSDVGGRDGRPARPGARPAFRSRLAIDETGGRPVRPQRAAPEGFRSRLSDDERPRNERTSGSSLMRDETGRGGERPRREGDSRPAFRYGDSRPERREGDSRPPRRQGVDTRPPRAEGDNRPPRRDGGNSRPPFRAEGDSRPPRREGDSRPPFRRDGDSRPPRAEGDSRPPRRDFGGDSRPPRREGDSRPPFRRDGDSRPPRAEGDSRPPRRDFGGDSRPPRREGDSRPPFRRDGDSRPPRAEGDSRPPFRGNGDSRPPRREGEFGPSDVRPPRRGFDSEARPPRAEGDSRPPFRAGGDSRPPRREGDSRPPFRRDGDSRPPRAEGDSRPPFRGSGDSRPPRPAGSSDSRPPRPAGSSSSRPPFRGSGDSRPPRREGDSRPPRPAGSSDSRPPRPAFKRRKEDDE